MRERQKAIVTPGAAALADFAAGLAGFQRGFTTALPILRRWMRPGWEGRLYVAAATTSVFGGRPASGA